MADQKLTALSELSVVALDDITYLVDDVAGTPTSVKLSVNRLGGLLAHGICQGRLTTESGVPVSTSDRTSQGTIYFTPYNGNKLAVYDGTRWKLYTFSEISLALTVTSGSNYDVFVYDNAGTLTLELSSAWTNDTTRADALALQDGIYVKSGATTRRWLGTLRASGSNVTEDSVTKAFVWNAYNPVWRPLRKYDATVSWTYGSTTWRSANNSTANRVEVVVGAVGTAIDLLNAGLCQALSSAAGVLGIGEDSTSTPSTSVVGGAYLFNGVGVAVSTSLNSRLVKYIPLGYHYYQWLERADAGTVTFFGDDSTNLTFRCGLTGRSMR